MLGAAPEEERAALAPDNSFSKAHSLISQLTQSAKSRAAAWRRRVNGAGSAGENHHLSPSVGRLGSVRPVAPFAVWFQAQPQSQRNMVFPMLPCQWSLSPGV